MPLEILFQHFILQDEKLHGRGKLFLVCRNIIPIRGDESDDVKKMDPKKIMFSCDEKTTRAGESVQKARTSFSCLFVGKGFYLGVVRL